MIVPRKLKRDIALTISAVALLNGCNLDKKTEYIEKTEYVEVEVEKSGYIPSSIVQKTTSGYVQGSALSDGVLAWLGVPYAQPPINNLRWKKPLAVTAWDGLKKTNSFGQVCTQTSSYTGKIIGGEDCLFLNIWRPETESTNLPILVFLHGGGNLSGSGAEFDGTLLSKNTNAIIISINYRVGPLGFIRHSSLRTGDSIDNSGNYGLLDIIQALKWVKENAAVFGGNHNNVTVAGQSAGARDALALLISPQAKGLFSKAMALSGGLTTSTIEQGEDRANKVIAELLVADGLAADINAANNMMSDNAYINDYLMKKTAGDLVTAFNKSSYGYASQAIRMAAFPHLFADGTVIPQSGFNSFSSKDISSDVPLILGSTNSEFASFPVTDPDLGVPLLNMRKGDLTSDTMQKYIKARLYGSKIYNGFAVENVVDRFKENGYNSPIYSYRFAWGDNYGVFKSPCDLIGATHGNDLDLILDRKTLFFNSMFSNCAYYDDNELGRKSLATAFQAYIHNFLYSGSPNSSELVEWPESKTAKSYLVLDANTQSTDIYSSADWHQKDIILSEMETDLDATTYDLLVNKVFAGRFFMEHWK